MPGEYTIAGGLTDAQRLARQAHVMAGATERFLAGLGLAAGWSCLDVGCGDGQVTIAMAQAAGPDGRAVGVDVDAAALGTLRSDPPAPALDRLQGVYGATVRFHGGDPTIGPRLRALFGAAGLRDVREGTVVNPMESVDDKLFLAQLVKNMRESIQEAGAGTDEEIDALAHDVAEAARDPATTFYQVRIHQVSGRRPGRRAS